MPQPEVQVLSTEVHILLHITIGCKLLTELIRLAPTPVLVAGCGVSMHNNYFLNSSFEFFDAALVKSKFAIGVGGAF
jgi:hypothetical protein